MPRFLKYVVFGCLLIFLAACSPEAVEETPTPQSAAAEQVATAAPEVTPIPTETTPPLPTNTPMPALPITLDDLEGSWLGAIYLDEKPLTLIVNINLDNGTASARPRFLAPSSSVNGSESTVTILASENNFFFDSDIGGEGTYQFTGHMQETGLEGTVVTDEKEGSFHLIPYVEHDDLIPFTGLYRFEDGRTIDISRSPIGFMGGSPGLFLPGLWLVNHSTGAYRALSAVSDDTFHAGPSLGIALPASDIITFHTDANGQVDSLTIQNLTGDQTVETALRQDFPTEDVIYTSEGVDLAGTVTLPVDGEGPYPAVVLVHGSGRSTRDLLERFTRFLANEGFAVLAADKRGVGESGGSYTGNASESRLLLLASDAAAGVELMAERPDVNAEKIGLLGGSQAGWIIPAAAVQSGQVAFMVNLSGPVVTVGQEGVYSAFTGDGSSNLTISDEELAEEVLAAAGRGFDPIPYISQLDIPGLWLFGALDRSVPIPQSVDYLQEIIDTEGKTNFSYTVFPNGDHALWESETGFLSDWPHIQGTVPGYFDILREWLNAQL